MNITRIARTRRTGFTLIEVLVAAGLCMLIMVVMTQAFAAGIDTFSVLKSTGELQERLAVAGTVLQTDLAGTHMENQVGDPLRVSGIRFDRIGSGDPAARPPHRGFFRIQQEGLSVTEGSTGADPDGIPCTRAGGSANNGHILHMSVKLPGTRQDRAFTANLTGNSATAIQNAQLQSMSLINLEPSTTKYCSQWAEVAYFLNPTPTGTTAAGSPPTPLFSLHRRIRVLTQNDDTGISWFTSQTATPGMSCNQVTTATATIPPTAIGQQKLLNGPGNITVPDFRLGGKTGIRSATGIDNFAPLGTGDDILLSNVISFEIKAMWDVPPLVAAPADDAPFYDLPVSTSVPSLGRTFDTWSDRPNTTSPFNYDGWNTPMIPNPAAPAPPAMIPNPNYRPVPLPIRLKAIQIKLRIYDPKNKLARQITLIQDM